MRIGIITGEYPPMQGGVGAYIRVLAGELARQGNSIEILSSELTQSDDPGLHLTNSVKHWGFGSLWAARQWARKHRCDVVSLQFQTAAYGMSPWIHFLPEFLHPIPTVTTFHDLRFPYLFPKAGRLRNWIVHRLARASQGVIVTNHEDYAQIHALPRTALIPLSSSIVADLPANYDREAQRAKAGAGATDFLIAYFGLFNRTKGIDVLLESAKTLREIGISARLVVIGGTGTSDPTNIKFAEEMQRKIEELGLAPYLYMTGFVDEPEVRAYLAASDVVAMPFTDGASYRRSSLMGVIGYSCAIVTTAPTVEITTFQDGKNMLLVPPGNSFALAEALKRLYESPDLIEQLRQGATELAHQFEWSQIAQDTAAFFQWVIEERP